MRWVNSMILAAETVTSRRRCNIARSGAKAAMLVGILAGAAQAQVRTWDGGGSGNNWSTAGNWSSDNAPDGTGEAALFTNDPVGQTRPTANLAANVTIGQLQFSAAAPSYTISGTGTSTLFLSPAASFAGVGITMASGAGNQTISAAEVEFLSSQSWDIGGTGQLLVTGTIEDDSVIDYGLTKNGTGTLLFPGDVRYDGATTVNAGAVVLSFNNISMLSALTVNAGVLRGAGTANALGSSGTRNTITLAGGALELANDTGLTFGSTSRSTIISGNATIRSDRLTLGAGVSHTLGTLRIGAQTLSVSAGGLVNSGTAGIVFGTTTLTAGGAVLDVTSGANLTLGAIVGNFTVTKQGAGQLVLNTAANANRTSAGVTLSSGTMRLGSTSALGTAGVPLILNGGTLDLASSSSVNAHNVTIGGTAAIASGRNSAGSGITHTLGTLAIGTQTLTVIPGANTTSGLAGVVFGATTLSGNATFNVLNSGSVAAQLTLGAVGQSGGARSLAKTGDGSLIISGSSSYTGQTDVVAGTLDLRSRQNIGPVVVHGGGRLIMTTSQTFQSLNLQGGDALLTSGGAKAVVVQTLDITNDSRLDITNNAMILNRTMTNMDQFRGLLQAGYADGAWSGDGLASSIAASSGIADAIGFVDNLEFNLGTFAGEPVTGDSVLIRYTYSGDGNLDGRVDVRDLYLLASHFLETGAFWFEGDFNYDSVVDQVDLGILAHNWQAGVPSPLFAPGFGETLQLLGLPAVPEPSMGASVLAALCALARVGRRKSFQAD